MDLTTIENWLHHSKAALLYFQNDRCAPCIALRPKVELMVRTDFPEMQVKFVDSEANPLLSAHFGVFAHPTLLIFFEGKEFFRASKYISTEQLKSQIQRPYQLLVD